MVKAVFIAIENIERRIFSIEGWLESINTHSNEQHFGIHFGHGLARGTKPNLPGRLHERSADSWLPMALIVAILILVIHWS
jgi:hypothetical protein